MGGKANARLAGVALLVPSMLFASAVALGDTGAASAASPPAAPVAPVGTVPELPAGTTPAGPLAAGTPVQLAVVLRSADPAGLAATAIAVGTPGSALYRQFLTPAQVRARFGPRPALLASVTSWLTRRGLSVGAATGDGLVLPVSGSAAAVSSALHTRFANYRLRSGRITFANTVPPSLPADLSPSIASVVGLDNTVEAQPHLVTVPQAHGSGAPALSAPTPGATGRGATPCAAAAKTASANGAYTADELARAYGLRSVSTGGDLGQGTTIALFELAGFSSANVQAFTKCYGIKNASVTTVKVGGGASIGPGSIEVALDIDDVLGLAPKATILVYEAPNTAAGVVTEYGAIAEADAAGVVSTSWGACERLVGSVVTAENEIFQEMALQGQSVLAASGDTGSADCLGAATSKALAVDDPASQPFVTGVGGTDLVASAQQRTETTWNDSSGSGGGGISSRWVKPLWQNGPGLGPGSGAGPCGATSCREVPDVSASASPSHGYIVFCTAGSLCPRSAAHGWFVVGGTSAAAPLWAAVVALADSAASTRAGFLNPLLYVSAATAPGAFHDVTTGNNDFTGTNGGQYAAGVGYDMATGLGSPVGDVLVPLLK